LKHAGSQAAQETRAVAKGQFATDEQAEAVGIRHPRGCKFANHGQATRAIQQYRNISVTARLS
jgi:hypothetical protein